ncbi:MAG: hypothetical protein IPN72_00125 [Saprospiraceae bacterium]|nr:hypothetical protein [Saprospiraceae bacterium]
MKASSRIFSLLLVVSLLSGVGCKSSQLDQNGKSGESVTTRSNKDFEPVAYTKKLKVAETDNQAPVMPKGCFSQQVYLDNQKDCEKSTQLVCGCNSVTYQNECEARKAGLTSWKKGKCAVEATGI